MTTTPPEDEEPTVLDAIDNDPPGDHPEGVTDAEAEAGLAAYRAVDDLHDGDNGMDDPIDPPDEQ